MKVRFLIVGSGWRAAYYVRIAAALRDYFEVAGVLCRSQEKSRLISEEWGVFATSSVEECVALKPDFVVVAVTKSAGTSVALEWVERGFYVLSETPAALDLSFAEKLKKLPEEKKKRLIVAEQYFLYPEYAALSSLLKTGIIGEAHCLNLSVAHDYHGASLMRFFLGIPAEEDYTVDSHTWAFPTVKTLTRYDEFFDGQIENKKRTAATIEFAGGKVCLYDFDSEQYRSPIRKNTIKIQGVRGEIIDRKVYYLDAHNESQTGEILVKSRNVKRESDNPNFRNIEEIEKITYEGKTLYESPFGLCGLSQDETAVASLMKMTAEYERGEGENPYPLEKALADSLMAMRITSTGV